MGHGIAQVTLDGDTVGEEFNSTTDTYVRGVVLWSKTGLANTAHTLTVTHAGPQGSWITLDKILSVYRTCSCFPDYSQLTHLGIIRYMAEDVTTATSSSPSSSPSSLTSSPTITATPHIPTGPIVGEAVGITLTVCVVLGISFLLCRWWWRRRRRRALFPETTTPRPAEHIYPKDPPQY
jgi:hypothetical protein